MLILAYSTFANRVPLKAVRSWCGLKAANKCSCSGLGEDLVVIHDQ